MCATAAARASAPTSRTGAPERHHGILSRVESFFDRHLPDGVDLVPVGDLQNSSGQPQSVNVSANERGERKVVLVYAGAERAGTYEFTTGRLTSLERGPEPPPPPKPQKPPKKQPATAKQNKKQPAT